MIRDLRGRVKWSDAILYSVGFAFFAAVVFTAILTLITGWL